jgi:predicted acyltransferase
MANVPKNQSGTPTPEKTSARIHSIDDFRGWAIFSMILVNYLGMFESMPWQFKHHDYGMSFADTVAPLFMFVVGMGLRHSFQRRIASASLVAACAHVLRRCVVLILIGMVLYGPSPDNWRYWWDALVDIGFAGILALPFMWGNTAVRASAAAFYLAAYQIIYSAAGYGAWTMENSIDGGPLGVLSWTAILLFGTIAFDLIATRNNKRIFWGCIFWGVLLCAAGWLLKIEWPGMKAEWPFSQRGMSIPYPLYATGLCFLLYLPFYYVCDVKGYRIPHLAVLGLNPLVIYVVQQALMDIHDTFIVSQNASVPLALFGFATFYLVCYAVARKLYNDGIVIKI